MEIDDQKKKSVKNYRPLLSFWVNNYRQLSTIFFAPVVAITAVVIANTVSNRIEDN
jgi:hypothetical protein